MSAYLPTNMARLEISQENVDDFNAQKSCWDTVLAQYVNPNTRTAVVNNEILVIYSRLDILVRAIQQGVKNNANIELLVADYSNLGIHENAPRRHYVAVPQMAIEPILLKTHHLINQVSFTYPVGGE